MVTTYVHTAVREVRVPGLWWGEMNGAHTPQRAKRRMELGTEQVKGIGLELSALLITVKDPK